MNMQQSSSTMDKATKQGSKSKRKSSFKSSSGMSSTGEGNSMGSMASLQTTASLCKDPKTFLASRGYHVKNSIAEGGFAVVYKAKMKKSIDPDDETKEKYLLLAIKVFNLSDPAQAVWISKCLKAEMFISKYLKHPNIVQTFDVLKTHSHGYIVMALAPNGSLVNDMMRLGRAYNDDEAKKYFIGLAAGLQYMHGLNIVHRDLKLDNFLLSAEWVPMIGDFGFAARATAHHSVVLTQLLRKTRCGTRGYMAPELCRKPAPSHQSSTTAVTDRNTSSDCLSKTVLVPPTESLSVREGFYDAKATDIFAMGVSLYEMLNMRKPFSKSMDEATVERVKSGTITYHNPQIASACKELIGAMLSYQASDRPRIDQVVGHKWLTRSTLVNTIMGPFGI